MRSTRLMVIRFTDILYVFLAQIAAKIRPFACCFFLNCFQGTENENVFFSVTPYFYRDIIVTLLERLTVIKFLTFNVYALNRRHVVGFEFNLPGVSQKGQQYCDSRLGVHDGR